MKKLMIMAVAAVVAMVSQAASVAWGGAISLPDGETAVAANTMAYLVYSDSAITGATSFDGTNLKNGSGDTVATMVSTHAITADEAAAWDFMATYAKTGSDVNGFYAVLVSDMNTNPKYSIYDAGEITGTTATSSTKSITLDWGDGYLTSGGYTVTGAVPEPTSGLLLLLGVAGLALKRKRA